MDIDSDIFKDVATNAITRLLQTERRYFRYHIDHRQKAFVIRKSRKYVGYYEIGYYAFSDLEITVDAEFTMGVGELREQTTATTLKAAIDYFLELVEKYD